MAPRRPGIGQDGNGHARPPPDELRRGGRSRALAGLRSLEGAPATEERRRKPAHAGRGPGAARWVDWGAITAEAATQGSCVERRGKPAHWAAEWPPTVSVGEGVNARPLSGTIRLRLAAAVAGAARLAAAPGHGRGPDRPGGVGDHAGHRPAWSV